MEPQLMLNGRAGSVDLSLIFNGKIKRVDAEVRKFLGIRGKDYSGPRSFTEPNNFYGNWVENPGNGLLELDRGTVLGTLRFLDGTSATSEVLDIREGEDEMNLIIGLFVLDGKRRVLYLEHEHESGKEEQCHLHSKPLCDYPIKVKNNRRYLTPTF